MPVGVDIEVRCAHGHIPKNLLHPDERVLLSSYERAAQWDVFLHLWTAREALLKSTKQGLCAPLSLQRAIRLERGSVVFTTPEGHMVSVVTIATNDYVAAFAAGPDVKLSGSNIAAAR
jgi:phosphopantetheinyl transferase